MAVRATECPGCGSHDVQIVKVHNPETTEMNADATLKCNTCAHQWEDRVTSDHHKRLRAKGWVI